MARRALPILVSLAGLAVILLLIYGVSHQGASRTLDQQLAAGGRPPAPDATRPLERLGQPGVASLASLRGKVVVLNFWASWCEPCQVEAPILERAQRVLERHNATVLGVTYLDASSDALGFSRRFGITYPSLRDIDTSFTHAFGTIGLPESFLIDRAGKIRALVRSVIDQSFVDRAIALAESS